MNVIDITEQLRLRRVASEFCARAAQLNDHDFAELMAREPDPFVEAAPYFDRATRMRIVRLMTRMSGGVVGKSPLHLEAALSALDEALGFDPKDTMGER